MTSQTYPDHSPVLGQRRSLESLETLLGDMRERGLVVVDPPLDDDDGYDGLPRPVWCQACGHRADMTRKEGRVA